MNKILYNKLLLQAEEAKARGMVKLAESIMDTANLNENFNEYSYSQLQDDVYKDMWKIASRLLTYYDINGVNIEKLDESLESWATKLVDDLEVTLNIDHLLKSPMEPKVPGENK